LLKDASPSVRIAAADALLGSEQAVDAWRTLAEIMTGAFSPEAKLEAANVIANGPAVPASIRPALESAAAADMSTEPGVGTLCRYLLARRP
jgi:hypothetical protein